MLKLLNRVLLYFTQACQGDYRISKNLRSPGKHIPFHVNGPYKCFRMQNLAFALSQNTFCWYKNNKLMTFRSSSHWNKIKVDPWSLTATFPQVYEAESCNFVICMKLFLFAHTVYFQRSECRASDCLFPRFPQDLYGKIYKA